MVVNDTHPINIFDISTLHRSQDDIKVLIFSDKNLLDESIVKTIFANNSLAIVRSQIEFTKLISPVQVGDQNHVYDFIILDLEAKDTFELVISTISEITDKQFVADENCSDFVTLALKDKFNKKYFVTFCLQHSDTPQNILKFFTTIGMQNIKQILLCICSDSQIMIDVKDGVNYTRQSHFRMRVDFSEALLGSIFLEK
jgi:hypothetical protein